MCVDVGATVGEQLLHMSAQRHNGGRAHEDDVMSSIDVCIVAMCMARPAWVTSFMRTPVSYNRVSANNDLQICNVMSRDFKFADVCAGDSYLAQTYIIHDACTVQ